MQGPVGPPGFPGTPGDQGPKGEKVVVNNFDIVPRQFENRSCSNTCHACRETLERAPQALEDPQDLQDPQDQDRDL